MLAKIFGKNTKKKIETTENRAYEGAVYSNSIKWNAKTSLPNLDTRESLETLRNRARQLVRDNAYAESAVSKIASNTVGSGIVHDFEDKTIQTIFAKWAESTSCDADGVLTYYAMQEIVMRELVEAGECLIRKVWGKYDNGKSVPLKLRILSSEYLDMSKNGFFDGDNYIGQGIEFDKNGNRVAYWIFPFHPENDLGWRQVSVRVPSEEIIHVYKPKRAGQSRGVSWLAPVLLDLKTLSNYEYAELKRKEISSTITGFLIDYDEQPAFGDDDLVKNLTQSFKPGNIVRLEGGKSLTLTNPQSDANYDQFTTTILRKIAVGMNVSYEMLTGDLSRSNFSSSRMSHLETQRQLELWRHNTIIPLFCEQVSQWFLSMCEFIGLNTSLVENVAYTAPRRDLVDPIRETHALILSIRNGLISYEEAVKSLGYNPEKLLEEIEEYNKIIDSKNIVLDSDPRKTSQQGIIHSEEKINADNA